MSNDICKLCKSAVMGRMANSENNPYYSGDICYTCAKAELAGRQSLSKEILKVLDAQLRAHQHDSAVRKVIKPYLKD